MGAVAALVWRRLTQRYIELGPRPGQAGSPAPSPRDPQEPGPAGTTPRDRLLDAAIDQLQTARHRRHQPARGIAEALGSNHRMLIYHFGSRGGLLAEVTPEWSRHGSGR